ncbi:amidase [uncultured Roseibium sp.]|uniref:amidase n=1 Tax=uncultured Roseibium sp. TaxID=1936171 RepID=UPI00262FABCE|nr:amidase [uncultured Roseibium sp.]
MTEVWKKTLIELASDLAAGRISSVGMTEAALSRADRLDPALNALVTRNDMALTQAAESDARRATGETLGPLDGIPFAVKDNILTATVRTTWGSPVYADFIPVEDETPVARLRASGMVILGKTNVPEFTLEGFTDNPLFGPTRNPWDTNLTPGGSSGGSVAGVAAGLFPAAIGTDGGGSIRRPCGYTGLFGLKPTIGRLPRTVTLPQVLFDMEVIGPITRDVESAALLFRAMEGYHHGDPRSALPEEPGKDLDLGSAPASLNILYVEKMADAPLDPLIADSSRQMAARLETLGHRVTPGTLPLDLADLNEHWTRIGQAGLGSLAGRLGDTFASASPKYREMADCSRSFGSDALFSLFDRIARLREDAARFFQTWDAVLTPSSAAMPWPVGTDYPRMIDGHSVGPRGHAVYTGWVNAIGHPAVNLPGPPAPNGLPIGCQLVGAHNRDWLLMRLALQYENAFPWHDTWPEMALDD